MNDGGPAFPTRTDRPFGDGRLDIGGLTLRDYFSAKAMQAIISTGMGSTIDAVKLVSDSYNIADMMIQERGKGL